MRGAEAIVSAVESAHPPLRLVLGSFAYDAMGAELEALRKEFVTVEAIARGADYPKGAMRSTGADLIATAAVGR